MLFCLDCLSESIPARDKFAVKTSRAVSSIEFLCLIYCEHDVRERLGGGGGHTQTIPLEACHSARLETYNLISMKSTLCRAAAVRRVQRLAPSAKYTYQELHIQPHYYVCFC